MRHVNATVQLVCHSPNPETLLAAAAKLCYAQAHGQHDVLVMGVAACRAADTPVRPYTVGAYFLSQHPPHECQVVVTFSRQELNVADVARFRRRKMDLPEQRLAS